MGVEFEVWHFGAVDVGVRKIGNLGLALSIIWCAKLNWVTDVYVCGLVEVFFLGGGGCWWGSKTVNNVVFLIGQVVLVCVYHIGKCTPACVHACGLVGGLKL